MNTNNQQKEQTPDPMDKWDDLRRAHTSAEQAENDAREDDVYGRYPDPETFNPSTNTTSNRMKRADVTARAVQIAEDIAQEKIDKLAAENKALKERNKQLTEAIEYVINQISELPEKGNTGRTIVESLCLNKAKTALSNTPLETNDNSGAMAD